MAIDEEPENPQSSRKRRRWGEAKKEEPVTAGSTEDRIAALSQSIQARLAAAKQQIHKQRPDAATERNQTKRAKTFQLDLSETAPTFDKTTAATATGNEPPRQTPKVNPYLAAANEEDETNDRVDTRLARTAKSRTRKKEFAFITPGTYTQLAELKRDKAKQAEVSGYMSGRKTGHTIHAIATETGIYGPQEETEEALPPRAEAHPEPTQNHLPLAVEWWDMELLPKTLKKQIAAAEAQYSKQRNTFDKMNDSQEENGVSTDLEALRNACWAQASLSYSKTAALVQHIVPIRPPGASKPTPQSVVHLTKKELKRQRKMRRQAKQRELQDLQAAGLAPAPEPRLTLSNFIRVLGDQAYLDPSQMEQKVLEQMQARQRAHLERNEVNKLTKEQRAAKKAQKIQLDAEQGTHVALFYVKDMSHPYHRAKVDLNAQQLNITGCVIECLDPPMSCIVSEGGPKAMKRFTHLLLVRLKWTGPDEGDDEEPNQGTERPKFRPDNTCSLVWQGLAVKRVFNGFVFQSCTTSSQARKILKAKGVAHYWDQVLQHASGTNSGLQFKLAPDDDNQGDNNPYLDGDDDQQDIIMKDAPS